MAAEATFEPMKEPGPLSQEDLKKSENLELWLVRVAPQTNPEELAGCKMPLMQGRTTRFGRLELTAEAYVPPGLHVLLPNSRGKKLKPAPLPVVGQVLVHESLELPAVDAPPPVPPAVPQPPPARRHRHPLLGTDYKKIMKNTKQALKVSKTLDVKVGGSKKKKSVSVKMEGEASPKKRKLKV